MLLLGLINTNVVDVPECIRKLSWIATHENGAFALRRDCGTPVAPGSITKVTAECGIEHDSVILEVGIDVTARAVEDGGWQSPSRRVRAIGGW